MHVSSKHPSARFVGDPDDFFWFVFQKFIDGLFDARPSATEIIVDDHGAAVEEAGIEKLESCECGGIEVCIEMHKGKCFFLRDLLCRCGKVAGAKVNFFRALNELFDRY